MKTLLTILTIILLAAIFLPIYNGQVRCGINPDLPCFNDKLNLIEYIKYKSESGKELLKECPDELILNKMPGTDFSKTPSSYYIKDGIRREISEYDMTWVNTNCTIKVEEVY